jgi:hypothetical protein
MRKTVNIISTCLALLVAVSCALIQETDISEYEVELLAPANGINTPTQYQTFWWAYVKDAEAYNLLILSPAFDSVVRLVADTNVSENQFTMSLNPGVYEWGVSAYNSTSATPYTIFSIRIDTSSNLTFQTVVLTAPAQDHNTNKADILFSWDAMPGVTAYRFTVRDSSWNTGQNVINLLDTTGTAKLAALDEGRYEWGVQAYDEISNTSTYWNTRRLLVDRTAPGTPEILVPQTKGDSLDAEPWEVSWRHTLPSLAVVSDSVLIATDSTFTPSAIVRSAFVSTGKLSVESLNNGKYYIMVKSIDAAGNASAYTDHRRFYLYKGE